MEKVANNAYMPESWVTLSQRLDGLIQELIAAILGFYTPLPFIFLLFSLFSLRFVFVEFHHRTPKFSSVTFQTLWKSSIRVPAVQQQQPARCQDHAIPNQLEPKFLLIQIRVTMPTNISNWIVTLLARYWFSFLFSLNVKLSFSFLARIQAGELSAKKIIAHRWTCPHFYIIQGKHGGIASSLFDLLAFVITCFITLIACQ